DAAIAESRRQYDQTRADFAPWRAVGQGALQQLARTMNISVPANTWATDVGAPQPGAGQTATGSGQPGAPAAAPASASPQLVTPAVSSEQAYLTQNPDVMAEYSRLKAAADPNSPWYRQHGMQSPEAFARWHYQNY